MENKELLKDMELLICLVLQEKGETSLKDLSKCVGRIKDVLGEEDDKEALPDSLATIDGCVDDIPRAVRMLKTQGKIERTGATPRDWRYRIAADFERCDHIPEGVEESLNPIINRECPT